jgi:hypothetical protein
MPDLEKAIEFVNSHGTAIEKARLAFTFCEEPPAKTVVETVFRGQQTDGGFAPFWAQTYSSLDATCYRLSQAQQLGVDGTLSVRMLVAGCSFPVLEQRADLRHYG